MIVRIDHVAVAVKDYDRAFNFFTKILGAVPGACADDQELKFHWQLFSLGDLSRMELLKPTGKGSFLDNFLENRQGGVHHITMQVSDINEARKRLEQNDIPYFGFSDYGANWKELFIHPRDAFGVLIQLAQFNPPDWLDPSANLPKGKKFKVTPDGSGCRLTISHEGGGTAGISLTREETLKLRDSLTSVLE